MKKLKYLLLFLCSFTFAQNDINSDIIISDTIHLNSLESYNVTYEKCPGSLSGIPCYRYLFYLGKEKPSKSKILDLKTNNLYYKFISGEILILDIKNNFKFNPLFSNLKRDEDDSSSFNMSVFTKKNKFYFSSVKFNNIKIYVAKMKKISINKLLYSNIMINSDNDYIDVYLIYN